MSTIYEMLRAKKGAAYAKDKIIEKSWLHKKPEIDKPAGALAGLSRIYGDVAPDVQDRIIDSLVELGARYKLPYRDIAHLLLICKCESGFNPDAAAGTTSAAGLGQYTKAACEEAAKDNYSKTRLGFTLDLTDELVFEAERGAYGMLLSYMVCKEKAIKNFQADYEKYLYLFHHEGWYFNPTEDHLAQPRPQAVMAIINEKILPNLDALEALLSQKTDVSLKLITKDDKPHADQPYVAIFPTAGRSKDAPATVQGADPKNIKFTVGKTDGQGKTAPVSAPGLSEVIFVILNKQYKDFLDISPTSPTGSAPAQKGNDATAEEIQKITHIANPSQVKASQKIAVHDGDYLWRRPPIEFISRFLQSAINSTLDAAHAIVEHKRSHIVLPDGNQAQKHASDKKVVAVRSDKTAAQVADHKKKEEIPHKTAKEKIKKPVELPPAPPGKPIRAGMLFPLPVRCKGKDDSYKTGCRVFGYNRAKDRKHAGRDLYAPVGTPVRAMDDGVIIRAYPFYCNTAAVEVDHGGFIVRYGEVALLPKKSDYDALEKKKVKRGDVLGKVGQLKQKGHSFPHTMCHLEIYNTDLSPNKSPLTDKKQAPFQRRSDLIDPLDTLEACVDE